jgi:hypothetical protein
VKTYTPTSYNVDDNLNTLVWWKVVQSLLFTLIVAITGILLSQ